jgi:hypothetical protein
LKAAGEGNEGSHEADPRGNKGVASGPERPLAPVGGTSGASEATSPATPSPRARLLASLLDAARAAAEDGDLEAARIAHRAAGELLGTEPRGDIVDLDQERRRRGG